MVTPSEHAFGVFRNRDSRLRYFICFYVSSLLCLRQNLLVSHITCIESLNDLYPTYEEVRIESSYYSSWHAGMRKERFT